MRRRRAMLGLVLLAACSSGATDRVEQPAVPVKAARATQKDAPIELRAIGTVEAYSTVALKARVDGHLAEVHFVEGQEVRRGDLLFVIDPRPFETALRQAEANVARDRAQAEHARVDAGRFGRLLGEGVVSKDEHERALTDAQAFEAALAADAAAVERARIDLAFTRISAPIDGRGGRLLVHEGNLVEANETTLAVINQLRPIRVGFAVPQQDFPTIRQHQRSMPLAVEAIDSDGARTLGGTLVFLDNAVDPATGTVLLKAEFPNPEETLWPGQFVDVVLRLAVQHDATVVPASAVQVGQQGKYVFVVRPDGTVESRTVQVGTSFDQQVVVDEGVRPGEQVVTEGQLRLAPGSRVEVKDGAG